ncbi:hypothetical protein R8Z57_13420 [Microbacterium sp. M3]|uniref:ABC transporter permease n=1 Tax=Microbacterium arthrosphaerae TaxID=792652 RepID=A0ABU4H366_9MICO|nr:MULTISPECIES: hypothetical protein [Microbacterium]MDW4573774.1 hypothetical protein [Microbacterium arthrosphaerae]MDW7607629.1 hypothetical protein [Microbacterium sp. M3]
MSVHRSGPRSDAIVRPTKWGVAALLGLVGSVIVALVVMAFVWPAATSQPQNLPVGISGPADAVSAVETKLAEQDPAPFALHEVGSRDDAVSQIESRELYGAILLGEQPEVLVASAASPVAAQALRGVAAQLQSQIDTAAKAALTEQLTAIVGALQSGVRPQLPEGGGGAAPEIPTVTVTDVVPLAEGDSSGAGLAASVFPLVLGGMLGGILLTLLVQGVVRRLVGLVVFGVAAGALITLVMQTWFGMLTGDWLLNAAVIGLGVSATSALIIGLAAVMGPAGIGVGAVITMFIANPIAGAAMPPQFLPEPWGAIGQFFVPGASATLLRSVMYFPDAATLAQWLILGSWLVGGVVLALIGHRRTRAELTPPAQQLEPADTAADDGASSERAAPVHA